MKKWLPEMGNTINPLTRGPQTRRLAIPKRKAKWALRILARLRGNQLAKWATRVSALYGNPGLSVDYDPVANLYLVNDSEIHAFAHPKRLWTLFNGQIARGKSMAYSYLLDQIDFRDGDRIIDVGANTGILRWRFAPCSARFILKLSNPHPESLQHLKGTLRPVPPSLVIAPTNWRFGMKPLKG